MMVWRVSIVNLSILVHRELCGFSQHEWEYVYIYTVYVSEYIYIYPQMHNGIVGFGFSNQQFSKAMP